MAIFSLKELEEMEKEGRSGEPSTPSILSTDELNALDKGVGTRIKYNETPYSVDKPKIGRYPMPWERKNADAAARGVVVDDPKTGIFSQEDYTNLAYYGAGPDFIKDWVAEQVKSRTGIGEELDANDLVRIKDGKLQYVDPRDESPRWREVDPGLLDLAHKGEFWGENALIEAATIGGGLAGSVGGPGVAVAGASAAQGLGTGLARYRALLKGSEMGINRGLTPQQAARMAGIEGLMGGVMVGTAGAGPAAMRKVSKWDESLTGPSVRNWLDNFDTKLAEGNTTVADVNRLIDKYTTDPTPQKFDPTVAQRSGREELLDLEATVAGRREASITQKGASELQFRQRANEQALADLYDSMVPRTSPNVNDSFNVASGIGGSIDDVIAQSPEAVLRREAGGANLQVEQLFREINSVDHDKILREVIGAPPDGFVPGTKLFEKKAELQGIQSKIAETVAYLGKENSVILSPESIAKLRKLQFNAANAADGYRDDALVRTIDSILYTVDKTGKKVLRDPIPWDFFDNTWQGIAADSIRGAKGKDAALIKSIDAGNASALLQILDENLATGLKSSNPNADLDTFRMLWKERRAFTEFIHKTFDPRQVRAAMGASSTDLNKALPKEIFERMFAEKEPRFLQWTLNEMQAYPEVRNNLRLSLLDMYKRRVYESGKGPSLSKHNTFIAKYGEHIKTLFPDMDSPINDIGGFLKIADESLARSKQLARARRYSWESILKRRLDSKGEFKVMEDLANLRMPYRQTGEIVESIAKLEPEMLAGLRAESQKYLRNELNAGLTDAKMGPTLAANINNFIKSPERLANYAKINGVDPVAFRNDLEVLAKAIELSSRSGKSLGQASTNVVIQATRAGLGPLHRAQRIITAAKRFSTWMDINDIYAVISDPQRLRQTLQYSIMSPIQRAVPSAVAADIGALGYLFTRPFREDEGEDTE